MKKKSKGWPRPPGPPKYATGAHKILKIVKITNFWNKNIFLHKTL